MGPLSSGILRRFVRSMALLALAPAVALSVLLIRATRNGMEAAVLELHMKLAETYARRISDYLRAVDGKAGLVLASLSRQGLGWDSKEKLLKSLLEADPDLEEIGLVRGGRDILKVYNPRLSAPGRVSHAGEPGYMEFKRAGRRSWRVIPREGAAPRLEVYYPFSPMADLRICVVLRGLWIWLAGERVGGTGFAVLVGSKGEPLIYPAGLMTQGIEAWLSKWPAVSSALQSPTVGSTEYRDLNGRMQVASYAPVPDIRGAVLVQQPREEAYMAALRMRRLGLIILLAVCAAALAVAGAMARSMSGPLIGLTRASERVAAGEFPDQIRIDTSDELQHFAETFNRMVFRLKGYAKIQVDKLLIEQRRTDAILFSIGDGILVTDMDGKIQLANRRALEILEANESDLFGRALAEAIPEGSKLREAVLAVAARPSDRVVKEVNLSTDERRSIVRVWARPLLLPERQSPIGAVSVMHDVTFEKELDKMKEEIVNSITHDLRSPVGSILGFLEFMRKGVAGVLNQQQRDMVEMMTKSADRLLAMINNILDVARMDNNRPQLDLKNASFAGLASHAIEVLASLAKRRGISVELSAEEEFSIEVDPGQIERVFTNLVANAIKFSPEDGRIMVSLKDLGDKLQAVVSDQGTGIPAAYLERIFEKFEQVPGTRRGGAGLGLTICRSFVEAHLGKIWAESEPGRGARFIFVIPKGLVKNSKGDLEVQTPAVDA